MQAEVKRFAGTFFDEAPQGSEFERIRAELAVPGVYSLELFRAPQQEVIQAKILLIQGSDRGVQSRIHTAVAFPKHRIQAPQTR